MSRPASWQDTARSRPQRFSPHARRGEFSNRDRMDHGRDSPRPRACLSEEIRHVKSRQVSALRVSPAAGSPPRPLIYLACTDPVAERGATRVVAPSAGGYQVGQLGGAAEYHRQDVVDSGRRSAAPPAQAAFSGESGPPQRRPAGSVRVRRHAPNFGPLRNMPPSSGRAKKLQGGVLADPHQPTAIRRPRECQGEVSGRGQRQNRIFRARPMAA